MPCQWEPLDRKRIQADAAKFEVLVRDDLPARIDGDRVFERVQFEWRIRGGPELTTDKLEHVQLGRVRTPFRSRYRRALHVPGSTGSRLAFASGMDRIATLRRRLGISLLLLLGVSTVVHAGSHSARPGRKTKPGSHRWEHWWGREAESIVASLRGRVVRHPVPEPTRQVCLQTLRKALRSPSPRLRVAAAMGLSKARSRRDGKQLWRLAKRDRAAQVRASAVLAIGLLERSEDVARLAALLARRSGRRAERAAAALALGLNGRPAARAVLEDWIRGLSRGASRDSDERYASLAVGAGLALLGDARSAQAVARAVRSGELEPRLTARLLSALGRIGDPSHAPLIREQLASTDPCVRRAAVSALGALDETPASRAALAKALAHDTDAATRGLSAIALAQSCGLGALHEIQAAHGSDDSRVRPYATIAYGLAGARSRLPLLLSQLESDTDPSRLAACALALGLLSEDSSMKPLRLVAESTGCPAQRGMTCLALGMVNATSAVPLIRRLLERTPDQSPRLNAAWALAMLDRGRTATLLVEIARHASNPSARESALLSIGRLGLTAQVEHVLAAATARKGPDKVRAAAVHALGCLLESSETARVRIGRGMHERLDDDPLERFLPLL